MDIIYSPEANGTLFSEGEDEMWMDPSAPKFYVGQWNYTQVCYFEHLPEVVVLIIMLRNSTNTLQVSHVGVVAVTLGLHDSAIPGYDW